MHRSIFILFAMLPLGRLLLAQVSGDSPSLPPGIVDGSKTPGLIPDQAAFRLVLLSLAVPPSPDEKALARQDAFLKKIGLSDVDKTTLKNVLVTFAANHSAWQQTLATSVTGGSTEVVAEGWVIVKNTRELLTNKLTTDGNTKLVQYVTLAKLHMRVMP